MTSRPRLMYETHMHTPLCKHATGCVDDYARAAWERNLRGITVTCHNPIPSGYSVAARMKRSEFDEYLRMVEDARRAWEGRLDVLLGMEFDFAPEFVGFLREQVEVAPFHYRLGSVHPQIGEYRGRYYTDAVGYQRTYYDHLAQAAETGLFDCLSHPDLVKNNNPAEWKIGRIADDIRRALDRIAAAGTAMELNTSGANKAVKEMNPSRWQLAEMHARGIPVVVGADAHEPARVGDRFAEALDLLADVGYREVNYFVDRKRRRLAIADARASLV